MTAPDRAGLIAALVIAATAAVVIARTRRTAADAIGPPRPSARSSPAASAPASPPPSPGQAGTRDLGVVVRLIDRLDEAVYDAAPWSRAELALDTHWRRMKAPFIGPKGPLGRVVLQLGFPSEDDPHKKTEEPPSFSRNIKPIGGVSQRQCIVAPAPSSIRYRIAVPQGARFETEVAVAGPPRAVTFEVAVRAGSERQVLIKHALPLERGHRWTPLAAELGAFAGRTIELELSARADGTSPWPALPLWASPVVLAPGASDVAYNVLWLSVDALRPDAIAAFHDEESDRRRDANPPPLEAWLPRLPEVAPNLDALARDSTLFTRAWSVATWTRPGVVSMLSGMPSSELGVTSSGWTIPEADLNRLYRSQPPLWPLIARAHGFHTRGWVNDFFLVGYSALGVDLGFEGLEDHREQIDDTRRINLELKAWLREHAHHRFGVFVHYNSPHAPYIPPKSLYERVPKPPRGPADALVRRYLGEVSKDDAAIGEVLAEIDRLGLRERTLIVVTADHGETLSAAHNWMVKLDGRKQNMRFRHATAIWEETARVPLLFRLPGRVPAGLRVSAPVTTIDALPTVLDLLKLPIDPAIRGRSLLPVLGGKSMPEAPVVVEGRFARSLQYGGWRLVERDAVAPVLRGRTKAGPEKTYELYHLETDPGERVNLIEQQKDVAAGLLKRLTEVRNRAKKPAAPAPSAAAGPLKVSLWFAGAGARRRVTGTIHAQAGTEPARIVRVDAGGAPIRVERRGSDGIAIALTTEPDHALRLELELEAGAVPRWELELDGKAWPADGVHLGALGVALPAALDGLGDETARALAVSAIAPFVDPKLDLGLYTTLDRAESVASPVVTQTASAARAHAETTELLREWGYVGERSSAP